MSFVEGLGNENRASKRRFKFNIFKRRKKHELDETLVGDAEIEVEEKTDDPSPKSKASTAKSKSKNGDNVETKSKSKSAEEINDDAKSKSKSKSIEEEEKEEEEVFSSSSEEEEGDEAEEDTDPEDYDILQDPSFEDLETKTDFPEPEKDNFDLFLDETPREFYDFLDKSAKIVKQSAYMERKYAERKVIPPFPEGGWRWRPVKVLSGSFDEPNEAENDQNDESNLRSQPNVWKLRFEDADGGEISVNVNRDFGLFAEFESKSALEKLHKFKVGDKVDVLDFYKGKKSKKNFQKWRVGEVLKENKYWIRIHFSQWDSIFDQWFHTLMDAGRVVEYTKMTKRLERRNKRQMKNFQKALNRKRNLQVVKMDGDGNCLFRSVAHQVYGTAAKHRKVRDECCNFMSQNKARFAVFTADDITLHIRRMKREGVWGDDTELRAMEELYDRPFELYMVEGLGIVYKPTKIHFDGDLPKRVKNVEPIRVSYHGKCHYNSVVPLDLKMTKNFSFDPPPKRGTDQIKHHREKMARKSELEIKRQIAASKAKEEEEKRKKAAEEAEDDVETVVIKEYQSLEEKSEEDEEEDLDAEEKVDDDQEKDESKSEEKEKEKEKQPVEEEKSLPPAKVVVAPDSHEKEPEELAVSL